MNTEQNIESLLKNSCFIAIELFVEKYLIANAIDHLDGALKASMHIEMCRYYAAIGTGLYMHPESVNVCGILYKKIHNKTQELTDHLDKEIGFPLNSEPHYNKLCPLFFEKFHDLAMSAIQSKS